MQKVPSLVFKLIRNFNLNLNYKAQNLLPNVKVNLSYELTKFNFKSQNNVITKLPELNSFNLSKTVKNLNNMLVAL